MEQILHNQDILLLSGFSLDLPFFWGRSNTVCYKADSVKRKCIYVEEVEPHPKMTFY